MAGERYVLLGLGTTRSPWFTEVARWATVGSIPADFVKCISGEGLRARLTSGRPFSALLIDAATGEVDRDLLDSASRLHVTVVVIDGAGEGRWRELGVDAVLAPDLQREQLLDTLADHSHMIGAATDLPIDPLEDDRPPPSATSSRLIAVTGGAGAGTSTVAMATAQGLAEGGGDVVLADLCLDADLAMLHDARDVVPGLQELVDSHRHGRPSPEEVRSLTFDVVNRGYHLLLGLRRHRDWAVLKPRTLEAAVDGLRATFDAVVADIDADLEGEAQCGSIEVEERNVMARTVAARADVVIVAGAPGVKGLHGLVRAVNALRDHGVDPERMLAVINRSSRTAKGRAELTRTFADLCGARTSDARAMGPVHIPDRRGLDEVLRDGARLPTSITEPITGGLTSILERETAPPTNPVEPVPVMPGSLGSWTEQGVAG